jgi:hypothetical protein
MNPIKADDPDIREARSALDSEFPGAVYDDSLVHFIAGEEKAKLFKKRVLPVLVKFSLFAGSALWLTAGVFPLSLWDSLTVVAGAIVFALLPLKKNFEEAVKGQVRRK